MNDNLTDSQRNLLKAMKREMVEVTEPVLKEIEALRREQRELHERGKLEEYHALRRFVVRMAKSLLALFGDKDS